MHKLVLLLIVVFIGVLNFSPSIGQRQVNSDVLERINVDTYLKNTRLVEYHITCLVYNGPCDKIGSEIKRLYLSYRSTGISTSECGICTDEQKRRLHKIGLHWQANYPVAWRDLQAAMAKAGN